MLSAYFCKGICKIADGRATGTQEQQGYMCGNSVCPPEAAALIGVNYRPRQVRRPRRRTVSTFPLLEAAE
jgi:DNA (cytosine-5)-methyltransferase 1